MDGLMINGVLHYVNDFSDFIDLVREYMGDDAYHYISNKYTTLKKVDVDDLFEDLVESLEDFNDVFEGLKGNIDSIMSTLVSEV